MEVLKTKDLEKFPTLEVDQIYGELKYKNHEERIYINPTKQKVNYLLNCSYRLEVIDVYDYKVWDKLYN
jgi:hypothetical protein